MDRSVERQNGKEAIEAEAAEWVVRLGDERLSQRDRVLFDQWRSQSDQHQKAYDFAATTWADLAALTSMDGLLTPQNVTGKSGLSQNANRSSAVRRSSRLAPLGAALAICLSVSAGLTTFWYGNPATMLAADYQTAPGETSTVSLPDGTVVDLSSGSAIALAFNDRERRVRLLDGAAYFTAAPMNSLEPRPFVVEGGEGTATALGTQFAVDKLSDSVEVSVVEHDVRVAIGENGSDKGSVRLSPGQSVRYSNAKGLEDIKQTSSELTAAWRRGRLIFDRVPLADVVAELNRYRRGRIVISNSALAKRQVSGVFSTDDLGDSLSVIVQELGANSASAPPFVTVIY